MDTIADTDDILQHENKNKELLPVALVETKMERYEIRDDIQKSGEILRKYINHSLCEESEDLK